MLNNHTFIKLALLLVAMLPTALQGATTIEAESMTVGGPYTGVINVPFAGLALYGNGDMASHTVTINDAPGRYTFSLRGASSNASAAAVTVLIDAASVGSVAWTNATVATPTLLQVDLTTPGSHVVAFRMDTDTGANDAYVDWISWTRTGSIPPPPAPPVPATVGALTSGVWRNLFAEAGHTTGDIDAKVAAAWQQLFYGNGTSQRIYYPVGTDKAYILDTGNSDVRSEGMSYGMMISVQLDKQEEFDRLWRWATTYMRNPAGEREGYFAWQCSTSGAIMDPNPASDSEVYFATALIFADARWGSTGTIDYRAAAQTIWDGMFAKELPGETDSTVNMFDPITKQIRFVPYASAALFTDPSYHLPSFLEVWSRVDTARSAFWTAAVAASRQQFRDAANATTGLMPDYSEFTGVPVVNGGHADFRFDAWRCAMNVAMDHAWNAADATQITQSNRLLAFFASQGIASYGNQWTLAGVQLDSSHSPGLVAMNAVAVLASNQATSWAHLDQFWGTAIPEGQYRYYDGCLYLMGLLHCSGKFRAWMPTGSVPSDITPPAAITNLAVTGTPTTNTINLTWTAPGDDGATGTATTYLVRYATTAVTSEPAWSAASAVTTGVPTPASAGTTQAQSVTGLTANTAYFFAVRARDEVGNLGALLNSVTASTVAVAGTPPPTPIAPTVSDASSPSPTLSGTTVAGATITIRDGGTTVGTVVASSGGTWTWTPSPPFTAGVHLLTVVASTTAGSSGASPAVTITVASVATPPPPTTGGSPATDPPSTLSTAERGNKGTCGLGGSIALIGWLGLLGLRARRRLRRGSLAVASGASPEAGKISPTKLGITAKTGLAS